MPLAILSLLCVGPPGWLSGARRRWYSPELPAPNSGQAGCRNWAGVRARPAKQPCQSYREPAPQGCYPLDLCDPYSFPHRGVLYNFRRVSHFSSGLEEVGILADGLICQSERSEESRLLLHEHEPRSLTSFGMTKVAKHLNNTISSNTTLSFAESRTKGLQ